MLPVDMRTGMELEILRTEIDAGEHRMSITIRCPCCDETFQANLVVAHTSEVGARNNRKRAAGNIEQLVMNVLKDRPGQFTVSGRTGLWERRNELPDELQLVGRDAIHKVLRQLLAKGTLVKDQHTNGGALSIAKKRSV
jgi:hypothetical protein